MGKKTKKRTSKADPCLGCDAPCCRYIMIEIDEPEEPEDRDAARWYVTHKSVSVRVLDGTWYVHFSTPCLKLDGDNRCKVYEVRPKICRKHPVDACERSEREECYDMVFSSLEQLDKYLYEEYDWKPRKRK